MRSPRVLAVFAPLLVSAFTSAAAVAQTGSAARAAQKPVWPDEGPAVWAPRPTATAITANDLRTRLYAFADDSLTGRRIGERGNHQGTAYIAEEFKRLGLVPVGDSGTYFQTLPYGPVGFDRGASRLTAAGRTLTPGRAWAPVAPSTTNGFSGAADLLNVPAVFAGRWGDTPVALDPAVNKGKVAVFLGGPSLAGRGGGAARGPANVPSCDELPDRFGAAAAVAADAAAASRTSARPAASVPAFDQRAARAGAKAILFVSLDDEPAAAAAAFTERNAMRPDPAPAATGAPAGAVTRAAAERLFGGPLDGLTVGASGRPVSGRWTYAWRMSEWPARNVVAIVPGSDPARAGEYVLVSAHNDHTGITSPVDHDSLRAVNVVTRRQGRTTRCVAPTRRSSAPSTRSSRGREASGRRAGTPS
ncbi:MAG: hypothetical protein FIA95_11190 [Gemmatimonadetes bacterium]|nr:hypothetical protein [Gemmatimonadota bacterium]